MGKGRGGKGRKGGGGGKKGKGKGNRKRKRGYGSDEEEGAVGSGGEGDGSNDEERPTIRGKGKGKGKKKGKAPKEVEEKEPEPAAPVVKARPSFDKLLTSFGVAETESEKESDEEQADADEESGEEEVVDAEGEESEGEEEEEADAKEAEMAAEAESDGGDEEEEEADPKEEGDGLDYYPRFWDDPPQHLSAASKPGANGGKNDAPQQSQFKLPALGRCEVRNRDIGPLLSELSSASRSAGSWTRCRFSKGVKELFEEFLKKENLEIGAGEGSLFLFLHSYLDVAFARHNHLNARVVRALCALHAVNHVLKASKEVLENNSALNRAFKSGEEVDASAVADKGFSRPRVLILCPFRSVCYEFVTMFLALCPNAKQVANKSRFEDEFKGEDDPYLEGTSPDWAHLFAGNSDDCFRLGLAVSRKTVRLYSPFDKSDLLICSPLGLRQITGAEGETKREFDFLSSIEVCIIDRADALRMQNWDHVREVMQVVNRRPQALADIDISRLRPAFADGRSRVFRQTVITTAGESLDADVLFKLGSESSQSGLDRISKRKRSQGKRKRSAVDEFLASDEDGEDETEVPMSLLTPTCSVDSGSCRGMARLTDMPIGEPLSRTTAMGIGKQYFLHVACDSLAEQSEQLFYAFENRYWKPLGSSLERLLIVAPSYYLFLKLRKFLRDEGATFGSVFEYAKNKDLSFARQQFFHGKTRVLLTTERFSWYRRYKLRGADYVLFLGPPETPQIFEDILSNVRTPSQCNMMCLFTRYDAFALERIVGHERGHKMLTSPPGKVFVYS